MQHEPQEGEAERGGQQRRVKAAAAAARELQRGAQADGEEHGQRQGEPERLKGRGQRWHP
jgi:hypothetical protein